MSNIAVQPIAFALGAKVTGVDLRRPLAETDLDAIRMAWTKYLVLVFPRQELNAQHLIDFTACFGELDDYSSQPFNRHPEFDRVMLLSNRRVNGKLLPGASGGQNWHTDLSYTVRPAKSTALYCVEKPAIGGDTMFANMYMAYESLSAPMRQFLDGLEAVHDVSLINAKRDPEIVAEFRRLNPPVVHPAVRLHPESGRKALYVNDRVRQFVGMSEAESKPIIRFLCEHSVMPRFVYRHRWEPQDLVMWDNRCLTHLAVGDFDPNEIRHMIRTSCMGDHYGRLETPSAASTHSSPPLPASLDPERLAAGVSSLHD
jgi:taurine dioxygenase